MAHPLLEKAANLIAQARTLNDEFEDKSRMPGDVAHKIDELLTEAAKLRDQVEREAKINDLDGYISTPQRSFDPVATSTVREPMAESKSAKAERASHAFWTYVKKGFSGMTPETKANLVEDATGMLLVPVDFAGTIVTDLPRLAVMRPLVYVRPTTSNKVDVGSLVVAAGGWGKIDTGSASDLLGATPAASQTIEVFDLFGLVKLGRDELEDAPDNLAEIIRSNLAGYFAQSEDDAIAAGAGSGSSQPMGMVTSTAITQKVTAATTGTVVVDDLVKLPYAVPQWAQRNGVFVGSGPAEQAVALLKDGANNFIWQPSLQAGTPARLLGYPWYRHDGLPTPGAGGTKKRALFFGDMKAGYMLADRRQLTVQRLEERFADEGKIGLLFSERVGGDVIRPKALAFYEV